MSLGSLLVLLGFILAIVSLVPVVGAYATRALALAIALVAFGVLLGADPLIRT